MFSNQKDQQNLESKNWDHEKLLKKAPNIGRLRVMKGENTLRQFKNLVLLKFLLLQFIFKL